MATIVATATPDVGAPHVTITGTGLAGLTVWRVEPDDVRIKVRGVPGDDNTLLDWEAPQQTSLTYTVTDSAGPATSDGVELPHCGDWLVHLADPDLSVRVELDAHPDWVDPSSVSVVDIPGRTDERGRPVAVAVGFDVRSSERGSLGIVAENRDAEVALRALLRDSTTLWLSSHYDLSATLPAYVALGEARWSRRINYSGDYSRRLQVSYTVVDRPDALPASGLPWSELTKAWSAQSTSWSQGLQ